MGFKLSARSKNSKKRQKTKASKERSIVKHHRLPVSRVREFGVSPGFPGNILYLCFSHHRARHVLFKNKTPKEVIKLLKTQGYMNNLKKGKHGNSWTVLFGDSDQETVIARVEEYWMGEEVAEVLGYKLKSREDLTAFNYE